MGGPAAASAVSSALAADCRHLAPWPTAASAVVATDTVQRLPRGVVCGGVAISAGVLEIATGGYTRKFRWISFRCIGTWWNLPPAVEPLSASEHGRTWPPARPSDDRPQPIRVTGTSIGFAAASGRTRQCCIVIRSPPAVRAPAACRHSHPHHHIAPTGERLIGDGEGGGGEDVGGGGDGVVGGRGGGGGRPGGGSGVVGGCGGGGSGLGGFRDGDLGGGEDDGGGVLEADIADLEDDGGAGRGTRCGAGLANLNTHFHPPTVHPSFSR